MALGSSINDADCKSLTLRMCTCNSPLDLTAEKLSRCGRSCESREVWRRPDNDDDNWVTCCWYCHPILHGTFLAIITVSLLPAPNFFFFSNYEQAAAQFFFSQINNKLIKLNKWYRVIFLKLSKFDLIMKWVFKFYFI